MCVNAALETEVVLLGSTEYIHVTITGEAGPVTPTVVEFAFPLRGDPLGSPTWLSGEIVSGSAQIRLGDYAGAHLLPAKQYGVYVRVTVHPERPVRLSGYLTVREG